MPVSLEATLDATISTNEFLEMIGSRASSILPHKREESSSLEESLYGSLKLAGHGSCWKKGRNKRWGDFTEQMA